MHDSQVAIPLSKMSAERVINLYDLMDSAYDAPAIRDYSERLGHKAIIAVNPRRDSALKKELEAESKRRKILEIEFPEDIRFRQRGTVERTFSQIKEVYGGANVRVRGHKRYCVIYYLVFL